MIGQVYWFIENYVKILTFALILLFNVTFQIVETLQIYYKLIFWWVEASAGLVIIFPMC